MTRICVVGAGATGSHAARQLRFSGVEIAVTDTNRRRVDAVLGALEGDGIRGEPRGQLCDVAILAMPRNEHAETARALVAAGTSVVSVTDDPAEAQALLELDDGARRNDCTVAVGAGFAPGFTCLLAQLAAQSLDTVDEIAVTNSGTGGPACARQHHWALKNHGHEWLDGRWVTRRGGTGRELVWFPDPLGAMDSYRAALASPILLHRQFSSAVRISARLVANRRDRLTMGLPMLRRPHDDGGPGGVRVELRGTNPDGYHTEVYGAMHHPAAAAGIVAAATAIEISRAALPHGAGGLATLAPDPKPLLRELTRRGLTAARFSGST